MEDWELEIAEYVKPVVMPVGRLGVKSVAVPAKPLSGVRVIVEVPEDDC